MSERSVEKGGREREREREEREQERKGKGAERGRREGSSQQVVPWRM